VHSKFPPILVCVLHFRKVQRGKGDRERGTEGMGKEEREGMDGRTDGPFALWSPHPRICLLLLFLVVDVGGVAFTSTK